MEELKFSYSAGRFDKLTPMFTMIRQPPRLKQQQRQPSTAIIRTPTLSIIKNVIDANIKSYFKKSKFKTHIAVYDTWPDINNAEKEVLFRIVHACNMISVGVIVINNAGIIIDLKNSPSNNPNLKMLTNIHLNQIPKEYISFVLSLHFVSPKTTLHYTLHALWNPLNFMDDPTHIKNLKSFDGYLSCYSRPVDNAIKYAKADIVGNLNHTLSHPILNVSDFRKDITCFYIGINWEQLNSTIPSRKLVLDLLKNLGNDVCIYGPRMISNVNVWQNWNQYKGEIPFDGVSIVNVIKRCGACLVLSSPSHVKFEISSNRLFEGLAAGVPLICDNHPFIKKWFGDNVFYIDTNDSTCHEQVLRHIAFIKDPNNTEVVIHKLQECRNVFLTNFMLHHQLETIINNVKQLQL
jgi:glycosyltransferase involved in cell wall biosynthesis